MMMHDAGGRAAKVKIHFIILFGFAFDFARLHLGDQTAPPGGFCIATWLRVFSAFIRVPDRMAGLRVIE